MKLPFLLTITGLVVITNIPPSFANSKGNGGIDVVMESGQQIPIEAYFEENSLSLDVCELAGTLPGTGDSSEWKKALNTVVSSLHAKLPGAARMLYEALRNETLFYILTLEKGAGIYFTDDDGKILDIQKINGAVRLYGSKDVYILRDAWMNYAAHAGTPFNYKNMLVRTLHEALLRYYKEDPKQGKHPLGQAVIEILRLAGFYPEANAQASTRLSEMPAKEVAEFFKSRNLVPTKIPTVSESFETVFELTLPSFSIEPLKWWPSPAIQLSNILRFGEKSKEAEKLWAQFGADHPELQKYMTGMADHLSSSIRKATPLRFSYLEKSDPAYQALQNLTQEKSTFAFKLTDLNWKGDQAHSKPAQRTNYLFNFTLTESARKEILDSSQVPVVCKD